MDAITQGCMDEETSVGGDPLYWGLTPAEGTAGHSFNTSAGPYGDTTYEFEFYTSADLTGTNVALNRPISWDAVDNVGFPITNANDGNLGSRYSTMGTVNDPPVILIQMTPGVAALGIHSLAIQTFTDFHPKNWDLITSLDGLTVNTRVATLVMSPTASYQTFQNL